MRRRERCKMDGDEYDFLADSGQWRRIICHSPQHLRWIKAKWNRRLRRRAKKELRERGIENG